LQRAPPPFLQRGRSRWLRLALLTASRRRAIVRAMFMLLDGTMAAP
jgi:hypothetical protein